LSKQPSQQFLDELTAHDKFVLNCCLRLCSDINDAEDLRQDVFIKAIRFHENFVSGTNMKGWLVRITKNTFINSYRKKTKNPEVLRDNGFSGVEEGTVVDYDEIMSFDQDDQQHLSDDLVCAIEELDLEYKNIVILIDIYGYNYREVSEFKGIPEGTIKSRLFRARGILRDKLRDKASSYGISYVKKKSNRKKG
jgi:RNA polymerase sigma-70 factor (ECF subfamily)